MAISLVQKKALGGTDTETGFTITLDQAPTEGNILFAFVTHDGSGPTSASGWTEVDDRTDTNNAVTLATYWKEAGASEPAAQTFSTIPAEKWSGVIYEFSGVDTSSPVDGTSQYDDGDSTTPTSPTFTPSVNGVMVMAGFGINNVTTATVDGDLSQPWNEQSSAVGACESAGGIELRADTTATGTYIHGASPGQEWIAYTVGATPDTGDTPLNADSATFTVTGSDVTLSAEIKEIDADSATFEVAFSDVTLFAPFGWWRTPWWGDEWWQAPWWGQIDASRELPADSATYTVSGSDVDLNKGFTLSAASATFTVTGAAVDLEHGRQVDADPATFTVTGSDVTFNYYNLPVDSATFTVTGNDDVELDRTSLISYSLPVDNATFTVTGSDVELDRGYILAAATAAFTVTGTVVDLEVDNELPALRATVTVSASDVSLYAPSLSKIDADPASFSVSASDITFSKDAIAVTFGQYDKTNIIKPEPHGVRISPEGEGFFFR